MLYTAVVKYVTLDNECVRSEFTDKSLHKKNDSQRRHCVILAYMYK